MNSRYEDDNATDPRRMNSSATPPTAVVCAPHVRHCRAQSYSTDGGESWSPRVAVGALPDPGIKGGLARWPQRKSLIFANAAGLATGEVNTHLTIYTSPNDGKTWPRSKLLYARPVGYTVVQLVGETTAAILYSRDGKCGPALTIALVDLNTLTPRDNIAGSVAYLGH